MGNICLYLKKIYEYEYEYTNRQNMMHMVTILTDIVVFGWKFEIHTLLTHTEVLMNLMFLVRYLC